MNMIGTSINIEKGRLAQFRNAAQRLKVPESELLSMLLQKSRKLLGNSAVIKQRVKYQRGYDPADYRIHHVIFSGVDYEFATGRRYLFKISVSFLIRLAIDNFLEEIIRDWTQKPAEAAMERLAYLTNFHYAHFDVGRILGNSSESWVIPWPR